MDTLFEGVFSEYTIREVAFKPKGANAYTSVDGAGQMTEEYERRTVSKAKSNVVVKKIPRGSGSGSLGLRLHMPLEIYNTLQGFLKGAAGKVITGVYALPARTKVPDVEIAVKVEDEDGDIKFKYFPKAASSSFSKSVDSEGDTVAEVEMNFDLSADEYENLAYESLEDDLPTTGSLTAENWMTTVSSSLLQAPGGSTGSTGGTGTTA